MSQTLTECWCIYSLIVLINHIINVLLFLYHAMHAICMGEYLIKIIGPGCFVW